jgi:transposase
VTVDANGKPLRFVLTAGQAHESPHAEALLEDLSPDFVLGDKAYDVDAIRDLILALGAEPVIPPKSNRNDPADYDKEHYKARNLIERFIGKLKHFRRVFSRFDKLAHNYLSFLHFASVLIWLR